MSSARSIADLSSTKFSSNRDLLSWVQRVSELTEPAQVHWCDGSESEYQALLAKMVADGTMVELNPQTHPGCYYHRSDPSDVARTEHLTFICADSAAEVGPTNNWMAPEEAKAKVTPLFKGAMRGRTMYVVPYLMGPEGSPSARAGVEITDSAYVAASMRIMTRMGKPALQELDRLESQGTPALYCKGMHSLGDLSPDRRYILHFPKDREIWSIGSGYGGNALLGKKCFALRIASTMARDEGWLAEHMLILGLQDPQGKTSYICAAFPSACGKTNLAMLVPPDSLPGWKIWTVGDDIAWLRVGDDGRLWAINPEAGFFGVAPGTSSKTNPNAMASLDRNCFFTNTALTPDKEPWWEGMDGEVPERLTDWRGRSWERGSTEVAAHPNSRFTAPATNCPCLSPEFNSPQGVPISAFIFGGRRARLAPLVYEARNWQHGVFVAATMASETTAAATGQVGVVRRDPMAMLPFCGYNMGDYFGHWLKLGEGRENFPRVYHVNWFRRSAEGKFLWPGFSENVRVLQWIHGRIHGTAKAAESPIGALPAAGELNLDGLSLSNEAMTELMSVDRKAWLEEVTDQESFLRKFDDRMPKGIWDEHAALRARLT
jgi:phosphoenolpyruvate carboxykinase (GTP)